MITFRLDQFESIGENYAKQLEAIGITTVDDFYNVPVDQIQAKTGIDPKRVQQWAEVLDLFRIPKLSSREAELLVYANVNSVRELSHRQAVRIYYKLKDIDEATYLIIIDLPTFRVIDEWIYYAKLLTKRIKTGLNIPLVKLPMIPLGAAAEFQKYQIITVEEFQIKLPLVKGLRKKVDMTKKSWHAMIDFISLLEIDGIDVYFADVLTRAGILTATVLKNALATDVSARAQKVQEGDRKVREPVTLDLVTEWKKYLETGSKGATSPTSTVTPVLTEKSPEEAI